MFSSLSLPSRFPLMLVRLVERLYGDRLGVVGLVVPSVDFHFFGINAERIGSDAATTPKVRSTSVQSWRATNFSIRWIRRFIMGRRLELTEDVGGREFLLLNFPEDGPYHAHGGNAEHKYSRNLVN